MNREPHAVRIVDRLDEVARIMWQQDCGFVPVVDGANTVVGVVTDRDLCMASHMQGAPVASIPVVSVMVQDPATCSPSDTLASAMETLSERQVHRLPVVDSQGVLMGVLSSNDVLQAAQQCPKAVKAADVVATLAGICKPRNGVREFAGAGKAGRSAPAAGPVTLKAAAKPEAKKAVARKAPTKSAVGKAAAKPVRRAAAKPAAKAASKAKPSKVASSKATSSKAAAKAPAATTRKATASRASSRTTSRSTKGKAKA